jgi:hypothetical protein
MRVRKPQHIIKHMFDRGYASFNDRQYTRKRGNTLVIVTAPSHKANEMERKEWQRGYNVAYFKQLEKVKHDESRRRSETVHAG